MKQDKFDEAQIAYEEGNYRTALKGFLDAIDHESGSNGRACHMAGNCMMRLRRYSDAATAYRRALLDETYESVGSLHANLGTALVALGEYDDAVAEFEKAIDTEYPGAYNAYAGLGNAYLKCGKPEEAGIAYRKAALFEGNPDPGKSLVNLGICFMALDRPNDAAEAYKAALGFENYKARGKALANLGQAYVSAGRMTEALSAFEKATEAYSQVLTPSAERDYQIALEAGGTKPTGSIPVDEINRAIADQEPIQPESGAPGSPSEVVEQSIEDSQEEISDVDLTNVRLHPGETGVIPVIDEEEVEKFFEITEEDIRKEAREERKAHRRENKTWLRVIIITIVALLLVAGAFTGAYFLGFGYPSQKTTISEMMDTYAKGGDVSDYWVASPDTDIVREMLAVPVTDNITVDSIDRGPALSSAMITVKLESGAELRYEITLKREGLGWKVSDITPYFASNEQNK